MTAAIEVLAIRKLDGKSSVRAFVDLKIGGITIRDAKVIKQENQRGWLGMPGVKTAHGWQNVIEIHSKELRQRVTDVVLAEWQSQPAKAKPESPPWDDFEQAKRDLEQGPGWEDRR